VVSLGNVAKEAGRHRVVADLSMKDSRMRNPRYGLANTTQEFSDKLWNGSFL